MMRRVDYDDVASTYNQRYDRNRFEEVRETLLRFIGAESDLDVAEIGCGTGHWLAELRGRVRCVVGIDPSWSMLQSAAGNRPGFMLVRACAEALPLASAHLDRLFCINAMHHFSDKLAFVHEARRTLRPNGTIMIVGLDPHTGLDEWWVYDYFPSALGADLARYSSTADIRSLLQESGFVDVSTFVSQHVPAAIPFALAAERGYVDRRATSQLLVIDDNEYVEGLQRMTLEQPVLRADLRLFATTGRIPDAS